MNRTNEYDAELSKKMLNPRFAQSFFLGLMDGDEGCSLEEALKISISKMGIKEFAELANVARPNVVAFLKGRRKLQAKVFDQYLKPFHLKVKLIAEKAS